jgi:hypothetical protein
MAATKTTARKATKKHGGGGRWFTHRNLIAMEAMLLMGVIKDVIFETVRTSSHANWLKVVFVMAATIGLFGGLFFVIEKVTARGVNQTHQALKRLPFAMPTLVVHVALLFLLFWLYARMLKLNVF